MDFAVGFALPRRRIGRRRAPLDGLLALLFAAFSFRLLSSAHSGPCIRVRRSSDNALTDIGFAGGWLDIAALLTFVGAGSAYVVTWYDQSGQGRHITYGTAAGQPRIVNAGVPDIAPNGRPVIVMGAGKMLASAALSSGMPAGAADHSIVAVTALTLAQGAGQWRVAVSYGGTTTNSDPGIGLNTASNFAAVALGGAAAAIATVAGPGLRFCAADFRGGTTVTTTLDGASAMQAMSYNIASPGTLVVGGRPAGAVSWHEPMAEVLLMSGTTPELRAHLRASCQTAWGTP